MTRLLRGRRRVSTPVLAVAAVTTVALTAGFTSAFTAWSATTGSAPSRQAFAQRILKTEAPQIMTAPALAALHMMATGTRDLSPGLAAPRGLTAPGQSGAATGAGASASPAFTNVRVNNPATDTRQPDQSTQSETTIAVAGSHVAVGYNDSQQTGLALTAGSDLTGYSYSTDGGASFTDGGSLPNTPEFVNFGDPWLASVRSGNMYFSNLAVDFVNFNLDVVVAKSTNGGKTWGTPVPVYRPPVSIAYSADKPATTSGPDPAVKTRDDLYTAWDDFSLDSTGAFFTGLPVAHSTDGGATWHLTYAMRFDLTNVQGCSFSQFFGSTPIVNPADGTLYVVSERIDVSDPTCVGTPLKLSEWFFKSTDGGNTFAPGVKIANVTAATPNGLLALGPGRYMRTAEFPTIALGGKNIYVAWNDGALGHSHIRLAKSTDGGQTWTKSFVTSGAGDEVQPALSGDASGIHLLYYHRNPSNTLDVLLGNSQNGTQFATKRVTTRSFLGTLTIPQFDPILAFGYMGDYIANVSDGSHQYFAWGDNRDRVTGPLFPNGRNDPDVFFARQ